MSFDENGVSTSVDSYITGAGAPVFVRVQSPKNSYLASEPTTATPAFEGSQEEKLEKIMIQKWIALIPTGRKHGLSGEGQDILSCIKCRRTEVLQMV